LQEVEEEGELEGSLAKECWEEVKDMWKEVKEGELEY
jgi:hypothetical protein